MKIILCNKYFFLNGGTEKYLQTLVKELPNTGHTPIPFSVKYEGNWESPYNSYFLAPPGSPEQTHFKDITLSPANVLRLIDRSIYSFEAKKYLSKLLQTIGTADIAYILNIYNYMSPSIIHTFRKNNIPVVAQLGDYNLLCPSYIFLRDGKPCTLCMQGRYHYGLRYRCVKNSFAASAVRVLAMYIHRWLRIYNLVDVFLVPCVFMREKLIEGGLPGERIQLLHYPVEITERMEEHQKKNYIVYFGRISYEKGLDTLITAYQKLSLPVDLVIIGRSYDDEQERLQQMIQPEYAHRIRFLGFKTGEELSRLIGEALLSVVPSRCYDNAPISIYESFLQGTPVIASRIGGIPEQVQEGITGRLCAPDSEEEMQGALRWMLDDRERLRRMGKTGMDYVTTQLSVEKHMAQLLDIFNKIINTRKATGST
ncbi:MAG: glycosyltransferase family 4 protein [Proteobacteria bacterium]|nr:glycosyltransferase family 4 protein [Pseudomonadota bacterium]